MSPSQSDGHKFGISNILSTSIRYEGLDLNLCRFGHTSSILLSLIPNHDAIPWNGESQGVVGIIRPGVKIKIKSTFCEIATELSNRVILSNKSYLY